MTVGLAESKRFLMIEELGHWHTSRRSFTLLQAITVCGSLEYWFNTSCWGRFLFLALRDVVTSVLHKVYTITKDRPIIKVMILELARRPSPADLYARFPTEYGQGDLQVQHQSLSHQGYADGTEDHHRDSKRSSPVQSYHPHRSLSNAIP